MEPSTNSKVLFQALVKAITLEESKEEIESIIYLLLRARKRLSREHIISGGTTDSRVDEFYSDIERINSHEPIQYILGIASFYGREFFVDRSVLIPRPETEILVHEVLTHLKKKIKPARILDIGTGSGCIAVTLAVESPSSKVTALDVSIDALEITRRNAEKLGAVIDLVKHDFLGDVELPGGWDVLVSNPPYVLRREALTMKRNVTDFEPHLALFVPDNDPLIFYKAIARFGTTALSPDGVILVEINEQMGLATSEVFSSFGYSTSVIRDLDGKDRVVVAVREIA